MEAEILYVGMRFKYILYNFYLTKILGLVNGAGRGTGGGGSGAACAPANNFQWVEALPAI